MGRAEWEWNDVMGVKDVLGIDGCVIHETCRGPTYLGGFWVCLKRVL